MERRFCASAVICRELCEPFSKTTYALTAGSEFNAMATRADDLCPDVDWPRRTRVNRNEENDDALEA